MTAAAKRMEALRNNYSLMVKTGRILVKHVLECIPDPGSLQLHWEANANLKQLLSTTMKIRKIFMADKNDDNKDYPEFSPRLSLFSY